MAPRHRRQRARNRADRRLVVRLGAPAEDGYISKEMQWGTDQEPFARMAYEAATGIVVREAGFVYLPDLAAGCSVDGFIGDNGIFEAKCPNHGFFSFQVKEDADGEPVEP